ncbi:LamG-like jellyroll fold domain-containing protein [Aureliella helgolandensis]|uniref:Calcineurin-like phosphoesterase n=1 Tax=Aureliella helgolandensis TaxID=2527968 RepID=A0A518GGV4_9BACT|nr:LamG-like jellyroll fold domain-containing protein [Aureliella helgolandensis]QDV27807.1 Calcineurin-like phosphoesterase [Aureliella helgolandensis]
MPIIHSRLCRVAAFTSLLTCWLLILPQAIAHEGPDPLAHWRFNETNLAAGKLAARLGPAANFKGSPRPIADEFGGSIYFNGHGTECVVADDYHTAMKFLPENHFTISAWVSIDETRDWAGIAGVVQDNGDAESGWFLGYNHGVFNFALASVHNNRLTNLKGQTKFEPGRMTHVAATYDGETMNLYVNGQLDGSSTAQSGNIRYPEAASFVLGSYRDQDEFNPLRGCIRELSIYAHAAKDAWVTHEFQHGQALVNLQLSGTQAGSLEFVVKPFLQYGTQTSMTVVWQTSQESSAELHYGSTVACEEFVSSDNPGPIHTIQLNELEPETQYFYRTFSETEDGSFLESETSTFVTAVREQTPFAFVVIGDTQGNPAVASKLAAHAWAQRPSFLLHAGDLVDTGTIDTHWTMQFFPSLQELISRVPLYPVLGNHERNADNYFDYMALPAPEYYYDFRFGNAHFFMIDSNRNVNPESEQYVWLDKALGESDATWKFVCHHHPPYSSDENDYGNLWKTNQSTRGDTRIRALVPLYEKHSVDIVWNGHIHSYERTWPILEGSAVNENGTIYMITGGGGGGLETPGPIRPFFQNNVRRGHHYSIVSINDQVLEFKAFDLEDKLFDTLTIRKQRQSQ